MKNKLLFLYPLIYRPDKDNVSKFFALLSQWYEGDIVAMSGERRRSLPVNDFLFHSERYQHSAGRKNYWWLRFQVVFPLQLLWGRRGVSAVVSYDPYRSGLAAFLLSRVWRCKMIVELNGDYHNRAPGDSASNAIWQFMQKRIFMFVLRAADAIKVLNADQEAFCRRVLPLKPVYRFPCFVATEYFQSLETYQGDYVLSVGFPFYLKGMDVLIAAFLSIAEKHQHISLRIMGYCTQEEKLRFSALAGGHPRVSFIAPGWIEDVGDQLRGCYVYVNAGRSEAMGRSLVEAMACGKPIVATRTNGAKMCIVDQQTGFLCDIDGTAELAGRLDVLLSDRELAVRMGNAGKARMHANFAETACADAYHRMIEEVIGSNTVNQVKQ